MKDPLSHPTLVIGPCGPVCYLVTRVLAERGSPLVIANDVKEDCELVRVLERLDYDNVEIVTGGHPDDVFRRTEVMIPPPSLPEDSEPYRKAEEHGLEILTVDELLEKVPVTKPVLAVSGTNGKTTTAEMIRHVCEYLGMHVPRHLAPGLQCNVGYLPPLLARLPGDVSVLEIATFGRRGEILEAATASEVEVACVTNVTPDHLEEAGDFETYARCEAEILEPDTLELAVLNAQDPLVVGMPEEVGYEGDVVYYGIDPSSVETEGPTTKPCWCGGEAEVDEIIPWVGPFECPHCGLRSPEPDYMATDVHLSGFRLVCPEGEFEVNLPVVGLHNVYNALAAITTCCEALDLYPGDVVTALETFEGVEGRLEVLWDDGTRVVVLDYGHNPAGIAATLKTLRSAHPNARICAVLAVASELGPEGDVEILDIATREADQVVIASHAMYEAYRSMDPRPDNVIIADSAREKFEKKGTLGASREQVEDGVRTALSTDANVVVVFGEAPLRFRDTVERVVEEELGDLG